MIELHIVPVARPRMTRRDIWMQRPSVVKYWSYKDEIRASLKEKGYTPEETLHIEFHVPLPKSYSKKKKMELAGQPHRKRPDLDNFIKGWLDAVMEEDSVVHTIQAKKIWSLEGKIVIY